MNASLVSLTYSHLAAAATALWLCGAGVAWAGDGADLGSLQTAIGKPDGSTGFCHMLGMTTCPQLPTVTQAVLEWAGLANSPPEIARAQNNIPLGNSVTAGNPAAVPADIPVDNTTGLATLPLTTTMPKTSDVLATLAPLAFSSQNSGTAVATQLFDADADSFLYAVGVSSSGTTNFGGGNLTNADTAYFFYDDLFRNNQAFAKGQIVAKFSFLLTVLNGNRTENTPIATTLQIKAICTGGTACLKAQIVGGIGTPQNPVDASQLGIQFALVFGPSPASPQTHAIFEVSVPLLVTGACVAPNPVCLLGQTLPGPNTDPGYFYFLHNGKPGPINTATFSAFGFAGDDLGAMPGIGGILPQGASIGLAPTAAPFCTATTCPPPPQLPPPGSITYALCASLPDNTNGPGANLRPAVGAYYAIATDGEMLLSAPLPSAFITPPGGSPPPPPSVCPQL